METRATLTIRGCPCTVRLVASDEEPLRPAIDLQLTASELREIAADAYRLAQKLDPSIETAAIDLLTTDAISRMPLEERRSKVRAIRRVMSSLRDELDRLEQVG